MSNHNNDVYLGTLAPEAGISGRVNNVLDDVYAEHNCALFTGSKTSLEYILDHEAGQLTYVPCD